MPLTGRRAGTLPELLVALVLFGILGAAVTRVLLQQRRLTRAALQRAATHRALEQASAWLGTELAEFGRTPHESDLYRIAAESISYRAPRMAGLACLVGIDEVHLLRDQSAGWRQPQPDRDSMLLYIDPGPFGAPAGEWVALPIVAVSSSSCHGRPAVGLSTRLPPSLSPPDSSGLHLVRTFEVMQAKLYRSQGAWWLGARSESAGEVIQPVAGPLAPAGLRLVYRDSLGLPTSAAGGVREIELRLAAGEVPVESVRVVLRPRNLE